MNTSSDPILAVAARAARRAASVIVDATRDLKRLPTFSKEHADIVASAQEEAANAIVATISAAFPEHAVEAEGAGEMRPAKSDSAPRWVVVPIDGQRNFVHGFPYYAVSIALSRGNEVTHAVVLDPAHDEMWSAVKGKGAQLNGAALRVSACMHLSDAMVGTVMPSRKSARLVPYLTVFGALATQCAALRRAGACSLDLAHLAAGRLDGFWSMSKKPSDIAAGALLVSEAGGRVGDFAGGGDYLRSADVIAAAPGVFGHLRAAIAAAVPANV